MFFPCKSSIQPHSQESNWCHSCHFFVVYSWLPFIVYFLVGKYNSLWRLHRQLKSPFIWPFNYLIHSLLHFPHNELIVSSSEPQSPNICKQWSSNTPIHLTKYIIYHYYKKNWTYYTSLRSAIFYYSLRWYRVSYSHSYYSLLKEVINPIKHSSPYPHLFQLNLPDGLTWAKFSPDKTVQNVYETVMRWTPCSDDASVATMAAEKAILCVLFEEFSKHVEIGIYTCLILQNTLDVTVTALASRIKENIPIKRRDLWKRWFLNYCDPKFSSHFRMKRQTFQMKDNPLLTSETVLWSIWPYYFFCEYYTYYCWSLLLCYDILIFAIIWSEEHRKVYERVTPQYNSKIYKYVYYFYVTLINV